MYLSGTGSAVDSEYPRPSCVWAFFQILRTLTKFETQVLIMQFIINVAMTIHPDVFAFLWAWPTRWARISATKYLILFCLTWAYANALDVRQNMYFCFASHELTQIHWSGAWSISPRECVCDKHVCLTWAYTNTLIWRLISITSRVCVW